MPAAVAVDEVSLAASFGLEPLLQLACRRSAGRDGCRPPRPCLGHGHRVLPAGQPVALAPAPPVTAVSTVDQRAGGTQHGGLQQPAAIDGEVHSVEAAELAVDALVVT